MKKRIPFILLLWIIADIYFFQAIETLTQATLIYWIYWLFDVVLGCAVLYGTMLSKPGKTPPRLTSWIMAFMLISLVPKILVLPILLLEDLSRMLLYITTSVYPARRVWVSELGLIIAAIPFFGLIYGMIGGRHRYKVHKVTLKFTDLPKAFDGFTLTQLSDIHSGSFTSEKGVEKGINMVNAQKSDIILFTGDLVNSRASEMDQWIPFFSRLKAPMGKYSVLGNHDYGDYTQWPSEEIKAANLVRLKKVHEEIGFKLLLNEAIQIKKDGEAIALIGVENWGKGGFHKYGDLTQALEDVSDDEFKILMSHDPSHWEAKTLEEKKHINLTLAGHTHGMQFGIELFGFKWSPVKYMYPQWAGLYETAGKYLYVNRGFGFLGYQGRIGIWPEITVITLKAV
jgi:predicted MPP superfamily phosphohydrolase